MGTAGGVDVVIPAVEAVINRVDPALELHREWHRAVGARRDADLLLKLLVLRPAAVGHDEVARREEHRATIGPVDLLLEEKVWRQPLRLRGIDSIAGILERESPDRGL